MKGSKVCDLCGLTAGRRPLTYKAPEGQPYLFCCMGCRQVFIMLLEMADSADPAVFRETELFRKCLEMGVIPRTEEEAAASRNGITWESPQAESVSGGPVAVNVLSLQLKISGMWCPACAWYIETTLSKLPGIEAVRCHFSTDRLNLHYDPVKVSPKEIINFVDRHGYGAVIPGEDTREKDDRRDFIRLILSALFTANVMMLSFSLYSGFFISLSQDAAAKISWPIFVMASIVVFYGGRPILRKAFAGVASFAFGMETLISAGVFSAYFYSVYQLFSHSIHLYFDTASMLVTLVLLGKTLEHKAKDRIAETLDMFSSVVPKKARIVTDLYPRGTYVPIEQLRKDDVLVVRAGEILPADGTILDGSGRVDESLLTGEARNVRKGTADRLMSGSVVVDGSFKIKADAVGPDGVLGQMMGIMETAMEQKAAMEGPMERILQWFAPLILLLALGTGVYCRWAGLSTEISIMRAITVMVISCPCALGIAIPLARVAGVSVSGKTGILVRQFSSFEKAADVDTVVLDKTGTVTKGDWELLDVVCFGKMNRKKALLLAALLEEDADHAIAEVIKKSAGSYGENDSDIQHIHHYPQGISGMMGEKEIKIGSKKFMLAEILKSGILEINPPFYTEELSSSVFMSIEKVICAAFLFGDTIKAGAVSWIKEFREMGMDVYLISGDEDGVTRKTGKKLGIDVSHGEQSPMEKAEFISKLQKKGHTVAMVGDGINDAPAMARADLAVAIHGKNPLAKETGDISLMAGDPGRLLDFFPLAKQVRKKIRQNFRFSFLYNIISIPIAMAGLLTPIVAVCAMLASSLSVIGNTLTLSEKIPRKNPAGGRHNENGNLAEQNNREWDDATYSGKSIRETGN